MFMVHYVYIQVKKSMAMGRFHPLHVTNCLVHKASENFLSIFTKGICRTSMTTFDVFLEPPLHCVGFIGVLNIMDVTLYRDAASFKTST